MAEKIFEWGPALQSGDVFNPTISDSWDNLYFTSVEETLKNMMKELREYHIAGVQASTLLPAATEAQYTYMESFYSDDAMYDALKEKVNETYGYDIDDYILTYGKVTIGYATPGYSAPGVNVNLWLVPKNRISEFTFPSTLTTSSETISGYTTGTTTVYYYTIPNHSEYIQEILQVTGGPSWNSSTWTFNFSTNYRSFRINQGNTKTQGGAYFGSYRWSYNSVMYFSAINNTSRDLYNPSGTDTSTSGKYPSGEMGGLGTFDDTTDLSDISTKPSLNISDLGFFSIWNPSPAQLRNLADYVWNDPLNVQQWPQIFQSGILKPLDYIMSLSLFPLSPQQMSLSSKTFTMGGIVFDGRLAALGMSITMNQVTEQIIDVDMGTVDLKEYFGSFLDYAPYSQVSLYLPYYQTVQLSMNEVQNADSIHIVYRINLLDGSTAIKVHIDRQTNSSQNGSVPLKHVLYEYFTNLKTEIPLTSGANTEQMKMLATVMAGAAAVVAAPIAGAGASALAGATEGAATIGGMEGASIGAQVGNSAVGQAVSGAIKTGARATNKAINSLPSGGGIQRGNIGGMNNGLLSERRPFLIITRPIQVLPQNYQDMEGYTTSIFTTLGALESGFVQCESVDTTGLDVTASEKEEIVKLLQGGVFI